MVPNGVQFERQHDLLKHMPPLNLEPIKGGAQTIKAHYRSQQKFQSILGFGGAFTEAAALNWRSLTIADQKKVIQAYFARQRTVVWATQWAGPDQLIDFGPGGVTRTYSFDDVEDDVELKHFDDTVSHDVDSGIIPMILDAQGAIEKAGGSSRSSRRRGRLPHG